MALKLFRAPPLPNPPLQYDAQYVRQLLRALEIYFSQLDSQTPNQAQSYTASYFYGGIFNGYGQEVTFPYGAFHSTQNQLDGDAATAYALTYNVTDYSNNISVANQTATFTGSIATTTLTTSSVTGLILPGMSITGGSIAANTYVVTQLTGTAGGAGTYTVNNSQTLASTSLTGTRASKLVTTYAGLYNLQFSVQLLNSDIQDHDFYVWLRKNGTTSSSADVANSNSIFSVPSSHGGTDGHTIAALNLFIDMDAGDYVELMWHADTTDVTLETIAAISASGSNPDIPETPSVIATMTFVSAYT